MSADTCCETAPPGFWGRCLAVIRWVVPGVVLALLPKCPVCLAGYVALGTGIGLSFTAAAHLRLALIVLCTAALAWMVIRKLRHHLPAVVAAIRARGLIPQRR